MEEKIIELAKINGKLELLRNIQDWMIAKGAEFTPKELTEFLDEKFKEIE